MTKYFTGRLAMAALLGVPLLCAQAWSAPADSEAASLYGAKCATCHGSDGAGTDVGHSLKAPDLRSAAVQSQSDAQLKEVIKNGRNNMPPFGADLSDAQINGLIAHVRTFAKKSKSTSDQ